MADATFGLLYSNIRIVCLFEKAAVSRVFRPPQSMHAIITSS
jgi:hypothetical protein